MESIKQLVQRVNRTFTESNLSANELDELVEEIESWVSKNTYGGFPNVQKVNAPVRPTASFGLANPDNIKPISFDVNDSVNVNNTLNNFEGNSSRYGNDDGI